MKNKLFIIGLVLMMMVTQTYSMTDDSEEKEDNRAQLLLERVMHAEDEMRRLQKLLTKNQNVTNIIGYKHQALIKKLDAVNKRLTKEITSHNNAKAFIHQLLRSIESLEQSLKMITIEINKSISELPADAPSKTYTTKELRNMNTIYMHKIYGSKPQWPTTVLPPSKTFSRKEPLLPDNLINPNKKSHDVMLGTTTIFLAIALLNTP